MGFTRDRLEGMSDRDLECILARIFHRHKKGKEFEVKGEWLFTRVGSEEYNHKAMAVPSYITTWNGFGEALEEIDVCNFNIEMYCPADRSVLPSAVVSRRFDEGVRGDASHRNLRRALAVAAILGMYEAWYEKGG